MTVQWSPQCDHIDESHIGLQTQPGCSMPLQIQAVPTAGSSIPTHLQVVIAVSQPGCHASKLFLGYSSRGMDLSLTSAAPWSFNSCHHTDEKISISLLISRAHLSYFLFLSHSSLGCTLPISYPILLGKEPSHYRVVGPPNLVKSFFLDLPGEPGQSE